MPASASPSPYNKLNLPIHRGNLIERSVLLHQISESPCSAIIAAAGAGKTTLALQWATSFEGSVCWLTLSDEDNHPQVFWSYTLQLLSLILPDLSQVPALMLSQAGEDVSEAFVDVLTGALSASGAPLAIVIDEIQIIRHSVLLSALAHFARHLPVNMRLILVGRSLDPVLRAHAGVISDIAFTLDQAEQLLVSSAAIEHDSEIVRQVYAVTEGWAMGIRLADIALQGSGTITDLVQTYSAQYLFDQALSQLPPEQYQFLLKTSVVDTLIPALCDDLTGRTDSLHQLDNLLNAGLFTTRISETPPLYRYHPLLRETLLLQLRERDPRLLRDLYLRAAAWYAGSGMARDATAAAHASGDMALAAQYALQTLKGGILFSDVLAFREWLRQYPDSLLDEHPRLRLLALMATVISGQDREAVDVHLQPLLARTDTARGEMALAKGYIATYLDDDTESAVTALEEACRFLPHDSLLIHAMQLLSLHYETQQKPERAVDIFYQQYAVAHEIGGITAILQATNNLLYMHYNAEEFDEVQILADEALDLITRPDIRQERAVLDARRSILNFRVHVLLNRGQISAADESLNTALTHLENATPYPLWRLYVLWAEVCAWLGDRDGMQHALESAAILHGELVDYMLGPATQSLGDRLEAQRARILLRWGDEDAARYWLQIVRNSSNPDMLTTEIFYALRTAEVTPMAHLVLGDAELALSQLEIVERIYRQRDMQVEVTRIAALKALAHSLKGDRTAAMTALRYAIDRAWPSDNVLALAYYGLEPLLQKCIVEFRKDDDHERAAYLRRVLELIGTQPLFAKPASLTPAQEQIARLLLKGMTTAEIAEARDISVSGIRFHIRELHNRLLTRDRDLLIARLRELHPEFDEAEKNPSDPDDQSSR